MLGARPITPRELAPVARWPRELLVVLALAPPVLGLVFEPDGLRHDLAHQARSLLAIWIYVMSLGVAIQLATDAVRRRARGRLDGPRGAAWHLALVVAVVGGTTAALALPLIAICPGLDGRIPSLALRGTLLSALYVLLGRAYESFVAAREESAASRARAERQLAEARYAALVARTQPHFLHNALAAAAGLVATDPAAAERVLRELGSLFRDVVQATESATVRAADELETARRYLEVQRLRFAGRLEVSIHADTLARDELVPALVLLPLVENAVLHGLSDGGATRVAVAVDLERDHVRFTVEDDGPGLGRSAHVEGAGVGVADVRDRLRTLYGSAASIGTRPARDSSVRPGLIVEMRIPREDA